MKPSTRGVRVIQQMEAAECGVACLAMVLEAYGHACPLWELRDVCGTSRDGNSAYQLSAAARRFGLETRGLSLPLNRLETLRLPAILHWNGCHFVVLERCRSQSYTIVDPSNGRREIPRARMAREFSGVALELWPGPRFERRPRRSLSLARYFSLLRQQSRLFGFVLAGTACWQLLALAAPGAQQLLIDHVIAPARAHWLSPVILALLGVTLSRIVLAVVHGLGGVVLHGSLQFRLTADLGQALLHLPLPYIESRSHGDLLARIQSQGEIRVLMSGIVAGVFNLLLVTFLAGLMLAYDWFLGSLCLGLIALRLVVVQVVRKPVRQQVAAELTARGEEAGALSDAATAIELAKGLGIERGLLARYAHRVRARARWSIASGRLQSLAARVLGVLGAAMYGVILWFGGGKVIAGETTVGVYMGFLAIWALLEAPILSLVDLAEGWARARGLLERCDDILGVPAPKRGTHVPSAPPEGRLEVRNLGFRYGSGSPWLFRKVSFTVEPGEHVCIAGASGEGKSTLGMLLVGLLEPTEGDVLLDGTSVRDYSAASFARHVGVVQQTPVIFEGTVFDNLRLRRPEAGIDDVRRAAALAELDGVIQRLPDRYGERLQPLGRNLSGGERQRVAIAQALLDSPALVLLDEATSALDRELEAKILGNLAALGSTLVSIAHRAAMLEGADRLLLVHAGSVTPARSTRGEPLHAGHAPASGSEEAAACPAR